CQSFLEPLPVPLLPGRLALSVVAISAVRYPREIRLDHKTRSDNSRAQNESRRSNLRRFSVDIRQTVLIPGSADSSYSSLGTPFFPLLKSGLDRKSTDLVDALSHLELGGSEKFPVRFRHHQLRYFQDLFLDLLGNDF